VDLAKGEATEKELDVFIAKRDRERRQAEGERAAEQAWVESARRHTVKLREAARAEWSLYYEHMAEVHTRLAEEHREKAARLCETDERSTA
jgi:hypothetical protein